ncbi:MAG: hypothetical protein HYU57_01340 [Micavibrio aeruginosavorus]|nr:hypothetical protein [Micavibrio aeruginosavorus]
MTKTWFRDETNAKVVWVYKTGPVQPAQLKEMNEYCDTGKIPERLTCDSPTASKSNATSYQNCYADRAESQKAIAKKFGFDFD